MSRQAFLAATAVGAALGWLTASPALGEKDADTRLWDVVVLGPWLLIIAHKGKIDPVARIMLAVAGGATVTHNLRNMLVRQQQATARTTP